MPCTPQDIVGFTSMSKNVEPHLVMGFLNHLFSRLDEMCEAFDIYKVRQGARQGLLNSGTGTALTVSAAQLRWSGPQLLTYLTACVCCFPCSRSTPRVTRI